MASRPRSTGVSDNAIRKWVKFYEHELRAPRPRGSSAELCVTLAGRQPPSEPPRSTIPQVSGPTVLIMAAGEGTRMRSSLPKVLHPVCGRPMIAWPVLAAREAGAERVCVIVSPDRDLSAGPARGHRDRRPAGARRNRRRGARGARPGPRLGDRRRPARAITRWSPAEHRSRGAGRDSTARPAPAATVMTVELDDPGALRPGRPRRRRRVRADRRDQAPGGGRARGARDPARSTPSTFAFEAERARRTALGRIDNDNSAGEYYLGDVLPMLREQGRRVLAHKADGSERQHRRQHPRRPRRGHRRVARRRILERHMLAGVTIVDPDSTWIDADVEIAADAMIEPGTTLRGATRSGPARSSARTRP